MFLGFFLLKKYRKSHSAFQIPGILLSKQKFLYTPHTLMLCRHEGVNIDTFFKDNFNLS